MIDLCPDCAETLTAHERWMTELAADRVCKVCNQRAWCAAFRCTLTELQLAIVEAQIEGDSSDHR